MNKVVLEYLKKQGYETISTDYYNWIELWENWWKNEVDFHKYHDQSGKERKLYNLGMAKRIAEDWASILFTERDEITTEANTQNQTKANNEYLSKQLKLLKVYDDLPIAIEKAIATGTAGAILRVKHAKVDKQGNLSIDNRTKLDIIYVGASQIIPLRVEHGKIIDIAIVSENNSHDKKEYYIEIHKLNYKENLEKEVYTISNTYLDENGNVKKGYEGRVDFILTQLNEALGTEYTRTGEVIEKYRELQGEIDNLVEKKKAEIILEGKKQKWEKANEEEETATKDLTEAYNNLGMSIEEAKEKRKTLREELYAIQREANPIKELFNSYRYGELDNLENLISAYENSEARVKQCTENKKDYENNYILWQEGKYSEIGNTIKDTTSNWANASLKTIKDTISQEKENLEISKILYEKTGNDIYLQQQKQSKLNLENLANELVAKTQTLTELGEEEKQAWKTLGEDSYENYSVAMSQMSPDMQQKIQDATGIIAAGTPEMQAKADELGRKTVEAFDKSADAKQKGLSTITSYLKGISDDEKREFLKQAGIENADAVIDELNKGNLSEDSGRNILEGLWKGLKNGTWQGKILGVASGLAQSVNKAFTGKDGWDEHSPSKKMKKFAENYVQPISDVMKKRKKGITDTAKDLANSVNKSFEIQKINDEIYRKMQNAVARENASITARASIKANNSMLNVIQANFSIDGSVDIDGQKAGRILAPNVSKTLRMAGV